MLVLKYEFNHFHHSNLLSAALSHEYPIIKFPVIAVTFPMHMTVPWLVLHSTAIVPYYRLIDSQ